MTFNLPGSLRRASCAALLCMLAAVGKAATVSPWRQDVTGNALITALALDAAGRSYLGAGDAVVNGEPVAIVTRLLSDGVIDPTFRARGFGPYGYIASIAIGPDGSVFVAGDLVPSVGGGDVALARLDPSGASDPAWSPAITPPGAYAVMETIATPRGLLLIGGFTAIDGQPRPGIARINWDGELDTTFNPTFAIPVVRARVADDESMLVQDEFGAIRRLSAVSGADAWGFAITDSGPLLGVAGNSLFTVSDEGLIQKRDVVTAAVLPFPSLALAYRPVFSRNWIYQTEYSSETKTSRIRRYAVADGQPDMAWIDQELTPPNVVVSTADEGLLIAGNALPTDPEHSGVYRLRGADGAGDASFHPVVRRKSTVAALRAAGNAVAVGGTFDRIGAFDRPRIAKLTGTNLAVDAAWAPADELDYAGDVEILGGVLLVSQYYSLSGYDWQTGANIGWPQGAFNDDLSNALIVPSGPDHVVVARYGGTLCGTPVGNLTRATTGAMCEIDPAFVGTASSRVSAAEPDGERVVLSQVVVEGVPGESTVERRLVDGSGDPAWHVAHVNGYVYSLLASPDGTYIGGTFDTVDGQPRSHIARLRVDGSLDPGWTCAPGASVSALALASDGDPVYAAGTKVRKVGRIGCRADTHFAVDIDAEGDVRHMLPLGERMLLGGGFTHVGSEVRIGLALIERDELFDDSFQ